MTTSLATLLTPQTQQQVFQLLLSYAQAAGFPTTAWQPGGVERTRLMAMSTAVSDLITNLIPPIAGGSLLDYAPNFPGWMQLLAPQVFGLTPNPATYTQGYVLATNASSTAYNFSPTSPLTAAFSDSSNRYTSQGTGTIPANGSLLIPFQAESPGSKYTDPSNSAQLRLVTSLAGVTLSNPSTNFSAQTHTGSGTGTLTLSGTPVGAHSVVVSVTATSSGNPATISYSLDGASTVFVGAVSSVTNLGGTGINIALVPGGTGTSWVNGDSYSFSTPAPWIISQGADAESDVALAARCRNRWSSLSVVPTQSLYQLLATSTPGIGAQVTQAFVVPDSVINNKVNIIVSGPGGVLPPATIAAIQAYITPRSRGADYPVVQSPTTAPVTIAAIITGSAAQLAAVQSAVSAALYNYVASLPVDPTVRLADVIQIIMDVPGVIDCTGVTINGVAANLVLGGPGIFVLPTYPPTLALGYVGQ